MVIRIYKLAIVFCPQSAYTDLQLRTDVPNSYNIRHLKHRIREAAASVTADVLGRVWQEMEYCLDVYRATNGARIELLRKRWENYLSFL
jgi:hypothetical protein